MITPPKLRNDCFALPPGVDWVPLDQALERLADRVEPVVAVSEQGIADVVGRVLAEQVSAARANPPAANSAVDGYGFAGPAPVGPVQMPVIEGRAAAGAPFDGVVPRGCAIRVLTGAILPEGVDTVILQEDVNREGNAIAFNGPLKAGANTRLAGEDVTTGTPLFQTGRRLQPQDIALLAATGISSVRVFDRLRVGVLSTGDEIVPAGSIAPDNMPAGAIYDSNRPMLLALLSELGFEPVDLGHAADSRAALRERLEGAIGKADAILTSGGVSTGDEDHVSALLTEEGRIDTWRIAVKPGRPLALGLWQGVPVFGLPGNPVAALVCTLIFGRPALGRMAGENWKAPVGFTVPAAFSKNKKPGRREFLRARMNDEGAVEVFGSEGSGRISGLSWADGLVEIGDAAQTIRPGDMVRYIPYASFR